MLAAPLPRRHPDDPLEGVRERGLVAEPRLGRDIGEWQVMERKQLLRAFDAALGQPAVAGDAEAGLEGAREMADRQLTGGQWVLHVDQ